MDRKTPLWIVCLRYFLFGCLLLIWAFILGSGLFGCAAVSDHGICTVDQNTRSIDCQED